MISSHSSRRTVALFAALALLVSACGGSSDGSESATGGPDVDVTGVQQGCADLIAVNSLAEAQADSITSDDLEDIRNGISRAQDNFEDAPDGAQRYLELIDDALEVTIEEVEDRADVSSEQITLLLGVELLDNSEEIDEASRDFNAYFESTCGTFTLDGRDEGAIGDADSSIEDADSDLVADDEIGDDSNDSPTSTTPPPDAYLDVDTSSVGASGSFLFLDIEVGELWRTNVDPAEALADGIDGVGTGDEFVLVEIRVTSTGTFASLRASNFGWVNEAGSRTPATLLLDSSGSVLEPSIAQNESFGGYLVFPESVGSVDDAVLQVVDGARTPENIPLGSGAASSPYPVALEVGQTASGSHSSLATVCVYSYESEIRNAIVSLDAVDRNTIRRADTGSRFLTLDVGLNVLEVTGFGCDLATTMYLNQWEVRLRLGNGDVVAPYYFEGSAQVGAVANATMTFPFAADAGSIEFIDGMGNVLATWPAASFPAP